MADIVREVEFADLVGHARRADLGSRTVRHAAYLDTGAGRTVVSERVARSIRMVEAPMTIAYAVPIKTPTKASMTAMRLIVSGCEEFLPVLVAVSDKVIRALELPDGIEVLVGIDYLQAARVRMDLAPRGEPERLTCRPTPPRLRLVGAVRRTAYAERVREAERARSESFRLDRAEAVLAMYPEEVETRGPGGGERRGDRVIYPTPGGASTWSVAQLSRTGRVEKVLAEDVSRELAERVAICG